MVLVVFDVDSGRHPCNQARRSKTIRSRPGGAAPRRPAVSDSRRPIAGGGDPMSNFSFSGPTRPTSYSPLQPAPGLDQASAAAAAGGLDGVAYAQANAASGIVGDAVNLTGATASYPQLAGFTGMEFVGDLARQYYQQSYGGGFQPLPFGELSRRTEDYGLALPELQ